MARITHFEIAADEPQRAIEFYTAVFGWTFQKWDGGPDYWMVFTGPDDEPGINGGLLRRDEPTTGRGFTAFVCTASVDDLDATVERVTAAGGSIEMPRGPIPGIGWMAYAKDPEGNVFGLMQEDATAA